MAGLGIKWTIHLMVIPTVSPNLISLVKLRINSILRYNMSDQVTMEQNWTHNIHDCEARLFQQATVLASRIHILPHLSLSLPHLCTDVHWRSHTGIQQKTKITATLLYIHYLPSLLLCNTVAPVCNDIASYYLRLGYVIKHGRYLNCHLLYRRRNDKRQTASSDKVGGS